MIGWGMGFLCGVVITLAVIVWNLPDGGEG